MGVLWIVLPLDEPIKRWLDNLGISFPAKPSRFPTGTEIKTALAEMRGYDVTISDNGLGGCWEADIVDRRGADEYGWALLRILKYAGDDQPQELYFEKGSEAVMAAILSRITTVCGPLVLVPDTGDPPIVIDA
jgi:hypothetical protein